MTSVLFVVGEKTPGVCGVSDYTAKLVASMREVSDFDCRVVAVNALGTTASLKTSLKIFQSVVNASPHILHFQMPSAIYNKRFAPFLLPLALRNAPAMRTSKIVITFHESTAPTPLWNLRYALAIAGANALVFPSFDVTLSPLHKRLARTLASTVIPIGSNIDAHHAKAGRRTIRSLFPTHVEYVLTFFGLVSAEKRIEDMLTFVKDSPNVGLLILGGARANDVYMSQLPDVVRETGIAERVVIAGWLPEVEASDILAQSDAIILPLVRPNSGAFMAAVQHKRWVISLTPPPIAGHPLFRSVVTADDVSRQGLENFFNSHRTQAPDTSDVPTWADIAQMHAQWYQQVLKV